MCGCLSVDGWNGWLRPRTYGILDSMDIPHYSHVEACVFFASKAGGDVLNYQKFPLGSPKARRQSFNINRLPGLIFFPLAILLEHASELEI